MGWSPRPTVAVVGLVVWVLLAGCGGRKADEGADLPQAPDAVDVASPDVTFVVDDTRDAQAEADSGPVVDADAAPDLPRDLPATPDGEGVSPETADVPPDAADVPPDAADVPPEIADVAPEAADVALETADVSPEAVDVAPESADVAPEAVDECPDDPAKTTPGACGCGAPETPLCAEIEPPTPDPALWAEVPHATGPTSIAMAAVTAQDPSGVQYAFECASGACHDSGWQEAPSYEDTGLTPGSAYAYRVRARDASPNANPTGWSDEAVALTDTLVPAVVGLPLALAADALGSVGLVVGEVDYAYSDDEAADVVLSQEPAPGTALPVGEAVALVVSLGPPPVVVPDVTGLGVDDAAKALIGAGLTVGMVTSEASCEVAPNTVLGQQPVSGDEAPRDTPVALVVSGGPEQVVITELMYHPPAGQPGAEFVELHNPCAWPLNLEGFTVTGPGTLVLGAGLFVDAGGYVVMAGDAVAFQAAWGFAPDAVYPGGLDNGGEVVQVLTPDGRVADEVAYDDMPPWPVTPDGLGPSLEVIDPSHDNGTPRNWRASRSDVGPTPGAVNGVDAEGLPPWISEVSHGAPQPDEPVVVTARVDPSTGQGAGGADTVTLTYVQDWGAPTTATLADDGLSGDGEPGDGVYGVVLPGLPVGTLLRYRLDAEGPTGTMGHPRDDDTVTWTGTYLAPPVDSPLDVFHWLIEPAAYQRALDHWYTNDVEPALLFHDGVLYDGVRVRVRGQSSRAWPKKHWNLQLPHNHGFDHPGFTVGPVGGFNLQSSYADKSYVRETLSYETFRDAGSPSHVASPVTVWQNGQFFGLYTYLEDADAAYLARNGLDPEGGFFKAFGSQAEALPLEQLPGPWEEECPGDGDYSDLFALLDGVNGLTGAERHAFLLDALNVPDVLNYHAVSVLIHNNDQVAKNYYLYHDRNGTGRWSMQAWDMDLTFGRSFQGVVLNDDLFADVDVVPGRPNVSPSHPLFGDATHQKWDYLWNRLTDAVLADPELRTMYYRRLRTLMDDLLVEGRYEARIDALSALVADQALADRARWGWYGADEPPAAAVVRLKTEYLGPRRAHLFGTHRVAGEIPPAQSAAPTVVLNELMYHPADDPAEPTLDADDLEFVELANPSALEAVDVSGWQLTGVGLTLPAGSVILPSGYLLVVRNDTAFRAHHAPGHFVAAQYAGKLDNAGETVTLLDRAGRVVDQVTYDDVAPWPVEADGQGPSLERIDPAADASAPGSWQPSAQPGGSPGAPNGAL